MIPTDDYIIDKTQHWLRAFIVDLNICPFAKREIERNTLKIQVGEAKKRQQALEEFLIELIFLDNNPAIETTILIFPLLFDDFFHYLDFVDIAELLIREQGYEGIYQFATFHPHYCFADVEFNDLSNFSNRSPYPMLHIIREESMEKAIAYYGDTTTIPTNNITNLRKLGSKKIEQILAYHPPSEPKTR